MAYLATAIANDFLELAALEKRSLTQMHVQKLVYFSHGWNLALYGTPLTIERFEAWDYGPVIRRLWERLRHFGSKPVTEKVSDFVVSNGKLLSVIKTIEDSPCAEGCAPLVATEVVRTVWHKYGKFSALKLSELTHVAQGPWARARSQEVPYIDDRWIEEYFKTLRVSEFG